MKFKIYLILTLLILAITNISYAAELKEGIENFPQSYKPYLTELKNKHPNWEFTALYTNLDWNYVINNENQFGKNLVPKSYADIWKNTKEGEYNIEVDAGWVDCSRKSIEYTMDPRNFLNEVRILQFEELSYNQRTNNINGIEKILYGTEFYNRIVQYLDSSGNTITMSNKYSDLILSAGETSKVSAYHLASRIKQEVGPFLSHSSISGNVIGYEGLYNFYNIGATSSSEPMGAIRNGLQYAKDGKGASETTKTKYLIPWNTKQKAITGGAIFIGSSYINLGQNTIYLQKFHVVDNSGGSLFWHQYMTNVLAPYSESKLIYNGYVNTGLLNNSLSFIIPVYNNMPTNPQENLNIAQSDFVDDNTKVYANVENSLNVRTGPSTSYEIITSVDSSIDMIRIKRGVQSGELWDKVKLPNGIVGYVFHNYLVKVPERQIEQIILNIDNKVINKGETKKLNVIILPEEAKNHAIEYTSSNPQVAIVDSTGNITAIMSGTTTIKVKSKENAVFNQIDIEVYTKATDLQINVSNLKLQVGDSYNLNPIIYPTDATNKKITYEIQDENIIKIDENGKIEAIGTGKTNITLKLEDITKQIQITVLDKLEETEIVFDPTLNVQTNQITGWDITKLDVESVKQKITTKYNIKIYNNNGEELTDDKTIGTGSTIRIEDNEGIIKMEYKVIIYGDVNGDGKINTVDLLVLQRHILEIEKLKDVFLIAGNINKNGKNPSSLDSLLIQRHILQLKYIEQ